MTGLPEGSGSARGRFPVGLTVVCAVAFALLCALGAWQIQRLHWKQGLLRQVEAARTAAPVPFDRLTGSLDYRRVTLDCPGLATAPFVELYALQDGEAGVRLISRCPLPGRPDDVLVDRGFVADVISARPPVRPDGAPLAVTGVLRASDKPGWLTPAQDGDRLYVRSTEQLARALPSPRPVIDHMLVAETSTNPEWRALKPIPLPTGLSNRHLGYVITWFGLAAALAGVYAAMVAQALRRRPA